MKKIIFALLIILSALAIYLAYTSRDAGPKKDPELTETRDYSFSADEFLIEEGKLTLELKDGEAVAALNSMLTGTYEDYCYLDYESLSEFPFISIIQPAYKDKSKIDSYSDSSFAYPDAKDFVGFLCGDEIYILQGDKIAKWDIATNRYWVGKKTDRIDAKYIESLTEKGEVLHQ